MEMIVTGLVVLIPIVLFFAINYVKGAKTIEANGENLHKAYKDHPEYEKLKEKAISRYINDSYINNIFKLGAKMFYVSSQAESVARKKFIINGGIIFTDDIAIICDSTGVKQQWGFPCGIQLKKYMSVGTVTSSSIVSKQRSLVGSAVLGAVIAGEVGAVVGAVSANNANKKEELKVVSTPTGSYYLHFDNKFGTTFGIDDIFLSKEWVEKYHLEKYATKVNGDIFCISGCSSTSKPFIDEMLKAYYGVVDSLTSK